MKTKNHLNGSNLIREAIEKFPNTSNRALGKWLFETYPTHFRDAETARKRVLELGNKGKHKNPIVRKTQYSAHNPYGLPDSQGQEKAVYKLPLKYDNILWISDIHFPNHDLPALTAALNYGKANKINTIILGGDLLDNEPFTNHSGPPPGKFDVKEWFQMVSDFLDMLNKEFKAKIIWLEGNHDQWYERWLMSRAPVLFNDEYYSMEHRLKLKEKGITYLKQNVILKAGKLNMLHGHTLIRGVFAPVNPARGVFLKTKSNTMIGHCHQNSYHPERSLNGDIIGCWSVGCLCTLHPLYSPHNTKHGHGFAGIRVKPNGEFTVDLKEILNGHIL